MLSFEDAELLLQVVRDANLGGDLRTRLEAIACSLDGLLPTSSMSAVVLDAADTASHAFFRNNRIENLLAYVEQYRLHDPMGHLIQSPPDRPHTLSDFVTSASYGRDPFTGEFLPDQGIRYVMGLACRLPGGRRLALALQREPVLGDFTSQERRLLHLITPDLVRATHGCLLRERFEGGQASDDAHEGSLVLSAEGEVLRTTPGVSALAAAGVELPLAALAAEATRLSALPALCGDGTLHTYPLPDGGALQAEFHRVGSGPEGEVLCVLRRRKADPMESFELLAERVGFTSRQREIALLAVQGRSNRRIAEELAISPTTVGAHLSRVYGKAEVSSRTELALLVFAPNPDPAPPRSSAVQEPG